VQSSEILYVADIDGRASAAVRKTTANGSETTLISRCFAAGARYCTFHDPVISPNGKRVAMVVNHVSEDGNNFAVWISALNGSGAKMVTPASSSRVFRPAWTRYGRNKNNQDDLLAYQAGNRILQVNLCDDALPARGRVVVTGTSPSYSPDGLWIGYQSGGNIWKIRNSGSGATMVHGTSLDEKDPRWSKSSMVEKIIFLRRLSTGWKLYTMNADGSGVTQKVTVGAEMTEPDAATLPNAFAWEQDGSVYIQIGTGAPKLLKSTAHDPVWGHGTNSGASCM
jgi:Tol biopolymer transport system component